jgi:hypothetical protein
MPHSNWENRNLITIRKHRNQLALLLVAVSVLALAPTLASANPQTQFGTLEFGTITINATGQATPLNKGKGSPSSAVLSLNGSAYTQGNGGFRFDHLTGFLLVNSTNYTIVNGQGDVNNKGSTEINAKTNSGKHKNELDLHGSIQGTNVAFNSPQSKLSSLYFLSLTGQASLTMKTVTFSSQNNHGNKGNETTFPFKNFHGKGENETTTVTQTVNNTVTEFQNQTVIQTVTEPQNVTVTVTESSNQTVIVTQTQTVANSTVTEFVTVTVANTTITTTLSNSTAGP